MKKTIACAAFLLLGALALSAAPADVTYTEGDARIQTKAGKTQDAQIGDVMNTGDTLRTGADGLSELNQKGVTIKVASKTVFTLMEREQGGKTASVMSVALGSIRFRYDKLTGSEPTVRTNGAVAGVRGTEFSVFSGADGSTLIAVDSGLVTVESEGKTVDLGPKEGVEVPLGQPPKDKFTVPDKLIDYSTWNEGKMDAMLADPMAALASLQKTLDEYIGNVNQYNAAFIEYMEKLTAVKAQRDQILKEKGPQEAEAFNQSDLNPLAVKTATIHLNARYFSVGALSMRRFVAGRLYLFMKSRFIANPDNPQWVDFQARYKDLLSMFEQSIVPGLVAADI
ncbi:MAG: FecR domain-containing protein [Spirochaetia bacterium]|jgi:hypothetical protein